MKLLRKFPKNYQKSFTPEEPRSQKGISMGGPRHSGGLWAWPGGTRAGSPPGWPSYRLGLPLGLYFYSWRKNPRYPTHFSRSDSDLCRHRNLASGVTRILLRHPAGEGLGPRGHLHQLFFTPWCFLSSSSLDYGFLAVAMWYLLPLDLQYKVLMSCPTWLRSIWCNWCCVCWDPMNCYLVQS